MKLREKEQSLEEVTDTLKNFLSQAEDALLTKELYPYWVSALGTKQPDQGAFLATVGVFMAVKMTSVSGRDRRGGRESESEEILHLYPEFTQRQQDDPGDSAATPVQVWSLSHTHTHARASPAPNSSSSSLPGSTSAPT